MAKDALHVEAHTWPVSHARRGWRHLEVRVETLRPLRAGRAGTPIEPCGAEHRELDRELTANPTLCSRSAWLPSIPGHRPRSRPAADNHVNHLSHSLYQRTIGRLPPIAGIPDAAQGGRQVVAPIAIPASLAGNAINARTAGMTGIAPVASTRHPRPPPHRPDPYGSSRAASHHPPTAALFPKTTSITFRTHLIYEPVEDFPPQTLDDATTPRAAAPTDMAVGPEVAKDVPDVEGHTWPVPRARRDPRPLQARGQTLPPRLVLAATGGYAGDGDPARAHPAPAPPGAPARWPRRDQHLARLRAELRQLDPELAAALPPDPTRRSRHAWLPSISGTTPAPAPPRPIPTQPLRSHVVLTSSTHLGSDPYPNHSAICQRPAPPPRRAPRQPHPPCAQCQLPTPCGHAWPCPHGQHPLRPPGSTHLPGQSPTAPIPVAPRQPPATSRQPLPRPPAATSITFRTHFNNEPMQGATPQSPDYQTTPRAAAPTDRAVELQVATNVLDLKVHTWPAPHARRNQRR